MTLSHHKIRWDCHDSCILLRSHSYNYEKSLKNQIIKSQLYINHLQRENTYLHQYIEDELMKISYYNVGKELNELSQSSTL